MSLISYLSAGKHDRSSWLRDLLKQDALRAQMAPLDLGIKTEYTGQRGKFVGRMRWIRFCGFIAGWMRRGKSEKKKRQAEPPVLPGWVMGRSWEKNRRQDRGCYGFTAGTRAG